MEFYSFSIHDFLPFLSLPSLFTAARISGEGVHRSKDL